MIRWGMAFINVTPAICTSSMLQSREINSVIRMNTSVLLGYASHDIRKPNLAMK